ncbi:hypothetical protein IG5_03402 [Bacillus toyonensis]|nr:hypothetical protein IG5_03402 [Bacillus toyonensis]
MGIYMLYVTGNSTESEATTAMQNKCNKVKL